MKSIYIKFIFCSVLLSALSLHSCTLDEYNPGAFTKEALATSIDGYETLINQCYFCHGKVLLRCCRLDVTD